MENHKCRLTLYIEKYIYYVISRLINYTIDNRNN